MSRVVPLVVACLIIGLLSNGGAAAAPGDIVGSGHIVAGLFGVAPAFYDFLIGPGHAPDPAPWGFSLDVSNHRGETVEAWVTDNAGAGYFVEMTFYGADDRRIDTSCEGTEDSHGLLERPYGFAEIRDRCVVPEDAIGVIVYAHHGAHLDVTLVVV